MPAVPGDVLTVCVSRGTPRPVISVFGALDTGGAALLSAMLDHVRQTEGRAAQVDLTQVDYADSHGLAPLLDGHVTVCAASPVVRRLLEVLRMPGPAPGGGGRPSSVPAVPLQRGR